MLKDFLLGFLIISKQMSGLGKSLGLNTDLVLCNFCYLVLPLQLLGAIKIKNNSLTLTGCSVVRASGHRLMGHGLNSGQWHVPRLCMQEIAN